MWTIAKFGGSSLADAEGFRRAAAVIRSDASRCGIVVSAPGRRTKDDEKVTDLLYDCHRLRLACGDWERVFSHFSERMLTLERELRVDVRMARELRKLSKRIRRGIGQEELVSRGEYFSARLLAALLERRFLDSRAWLRLREDGEPDTALSYARLRARAAEPFVTPGFYGLDGKGRVRTLSRGGSDVTGALAAAALGATLYENFTDVPGLLDVDPRIDSAAAPVRILTCGELRQLCRVGTQVMHPGAVAPIEDAAIPMRILSTWRPSEGGTLVVPTLPAGIRRGRVVCFAAKPADAPDLPQSVRARLSPGDALLGVLPDRADGDAQALAEEHLRAAGIAAERTELFGDGKLFFFRMAADDLLPAVTRLRPLLEA